MNTQAPEPNGPKAVDGRHRVEVHSVFPTIQGEGPFAGCPAVFVRLAGCNLQCPACDTEYTGTRISMSEVEVRMAIEDVTPKSFVGLPLVVITGGEPFRQDISVLVKDLLFNDYDVQIETNGTLYQELPWMHLNLTVVCSPKTGKLNASLAPHIKYLKYVLKAGQVDPKDGLPISSMLSSSAIARPPHDRAGIFVQALDEKDEELNRQNLKAAIQSSLLFGHRLCIQTHKEIGLP